MTPKIKLYQQLCSKTYQENVITFCGSQMDQMLVTQFYPIFEKAVKKTFRHREKLLELAPAAGIDDLVTLIERLFGGRAIITNGSQQALDFTMKVLLHSGGVVCVEPYTYIGIEIPINENGGHVETFSNSLTLMSIEEIEAEIAAKKPTAIYLTPYFANPTNYSIPKAKLLKLRELAAKYSLFLIEDYVYGWLGAELDFPQSETTNEWVIKVGSMSKLIGSGMRLGWMTTQSHALASQLSTIKESKDLASPSIEQYILLNILSDDRSFKEWRHSVESHFNRKKNLLNQAMEEYMPREYTWNTSSNGYYAWIEGPEKIDPMNVYVKALDAGVGIMPGNVFSFQQTYRGRHMRLSISSVNSKDIQPGIKRLASVLLEI